MKLGQDLLHDPAGLNPSQSEIKALGFVSQAFVIFSQKMEKSGVEIVDRNRIAGDAISQFVGFSISGSSFDTTSGKED